MYAMYAIYRVVNIYNIQRINQYTQCTRDITGCLFLVKWRTVPVVLSNRVCPESNIYFSKNM